MPMVSVVELAPLRLADDQLLLRLETGDNDRLAGGEGNTAIVRVKGLKMSRLLDGGSRSQEFGTAGAVLAFDDCCQSVLPWKPQEDQLWASGFQSRLARVVNDLAKRLTPVTSGGAELFSKIDPNDFRILPLDLTLTADIKLLLNKVSNLSGELDRLLAEARSAESNGISCANLVKAGDALLSALRTAPATLNKALDAVAKTRPLMLRDVVDELRKRVELLPQDPEALAAIALRSSGLCGARHYANGQWLTVLREGTWVDSKVDERGVYVEGHIVTLHPWNHAPRELPRACFEALLGWWESVLRVQHSHILDALTGRRLDVLQQCVAIRASGEVIVLRHSNPGLRAPLMPSDCISD
eukprot:1488119-Prymnesium_polylepis.1